MQNTSGALSAGLSLLEIDSSTDLSLASPVSTSGSLDDTGSLSPSSHNPCCVSSTSSSMHDIPLKVRVGVGILPHNLNNVVSTSQPPLAKYSPFVNKISNKVWYLPLLSDDAPRLVGHFFGYLAFLMCSKLKKRVIYVRMFASGKNARKSKS